MEDIISIAAGDYHSLVLKNNGDLYGFGQGKCLGIK